MRFCKPRFNSSQAPLSRIVFFFEAILGLAVEVSAVRHNDTPGRVASDFLAFIDEEVCLQAAMMADAGDQNLVVTRLVFAMLKCTSPNVFQLGNICIIGKGFYNIACQVLCFSVFWWCGIVGWGHRTFVGILTEATCVSLPPCLLSCIISWKASTGCLFDDDVCNHVVFGCGM